MPGWSSHLTLEVEMTSLLHLGVFSFSGDCWARTSGLNVRNDDLLTIEHLQQSDTGTGRKSQALVCSSRHYELCRQPQYGVDVWSGRHSDVAGGACCGAARETLILWLSVIDAYVIVGVACEAQTEICRKTVCGLAQFFKRKAREVRDSRLFEEAEIDFVNAQINEVNDSRPDVIRTNSVSSVVREIFSVLPDREYFSYLDLQKE